MKLQKNKENKLLTLKVPTTGGEEKGFEFPVHNVHHWYPLNINFYYRYTNSKEFLYLVMDNGFTGENYYNVDILKRTKPLQVRDGVMFHPHVYKRNRYIISKARKLGLPTLRDTYTIEDVQKGFDKLGSMIQLVKDRIEDRMVEEGNEDILFDIVEEEWDKIIYKHTTPEEDNVLTEFGEMYSMLSVMRKIKGG